jgi:hypothetical protein
VHTPEAVQLVAASSDYEVIVRRLARYVRRRAPHALWDADAAAVRHLLTCNQWRAAIDHYFAAVGQRWDAERVEITRTRAIEPTIPLASSGSVM